MTMLLTIAIILLGTASLIGLCMLLADRFALIPSSTTANMKKVLQAQTAIGEKLAESERFGPSDELLQTLSNARVGKKVDSRLTIQKKLKYARWQISPLIFHTFEVLISVLLFSLAALKMNVVVQGLSLLGGPIFMRWLLGRFVERRFKRFDADYPQFLMSVVGLLKTGMTATGALESAAKGLDPRSLVRAEVELMIDRLRLGVAEDKSVGSFGEDIFHPEIELFVQALLLSRRVGGNLSETLARLAKQVRKRQYFRSSAIAAVSMQRGSIWIIIGILAALEVYLLYVYPELVTGAFKMEIGWHVWQTCLICIVLGIFWIRQITKLKI